MNVTRRMALIGLATSLLPATAGAQAAPSPPVIALTPAQMREDLEFLRTQWAPLDKSFSAEQRVALDQVVDTAIAAVDTRAMRDFVLDIMQAVAIPHNGHTTPRAVTSLLGPLPIRAWWFSDGLYIVSVKSGFDELLGAQIERLGVLAAEDAFLRAVPYISGTEQLRRGRGLDYLTTVGMLRRIGATADAEHVVLTLRFRDDSTRAVQLGAVQATGLAGVHQRYPLIPDDPGTPDRLPHVLDNFSQRPLTYAGEVDISKAWIGAAGNVLYVRSTTVQNLKS